MPEIKRGSVWYIENDGASGDDKPSRPCLVVSNNMCNLHSPRITVCPLTTQEKKPMPTHVSVNTSRHTSTVICEDVHNVSKDLVCDWLCDLTDEEMDAVNKALAVQVGLGGALTATDAAQDAADTQRVEIERDLYKELYEKLLDKLAK